MTKNCGGMTRDVYKLRVNMSTFVSRAFPVPPDLSFDRLYSCSYGKDHLYTIPKFRPLELSIYKCIFPVT